MITNFRTINYMGRKLFMLLLFMVVGFTAKANDGSKLWLDYRQVSDKQTRDNYAEYMGNVSYQTATPTIMAAVEELKEATKTMLGNEVIATQTTKNQGGVVLAFGKNKAITTMKATKELQALGNEGYIIRSKDKTIYVLGNTDKGVLYGTYNLIRLMQTGQSLSSLNISEKPAYNVRILDHWDNIDRSVERGYAGASIWEWEQLPDTVSTRYKEYARANASIGINAAVLNNVNSNALFITEEYLNKIKVLADIFRPYGIRVYLSINCNSPRQLGGLETADPLDEGVRQWWKAKADEIYSIIPDFGGFLVKANSEGQAGPQDYGRTHADGANMLAEALKPHGGIVMWRAFVYSSDAKDPTYDRAEQAYFEFVPFDGQFADNVIIQVKNGPIDFQPREPITSLFGAMKKTPLMVEFQITQEYLGHSIMLAYLAPMWKEVLDQDTYCKGEGSTVSKITDGQVYPIKTTAISGVSNIGNDANWTGHIFAQSNWYAFGRLAWNPDLSSAQIADEWINMTFTNDKEFVRPVEEMMLSSREAAVNYMQPLGLHHIFAGQTHYGPGIWERISPYTARPDWVPEYYHRADSLGIGFDRSTAGSDYVSQYYSPLKEYYNDLATCPDNLLLFFHHLPWDYKMRSGRTLWQELCYKYTEGLNTSRDFQKTWDQLEGKVDSERFTHVQNKLREQTRDAIWWRDAVLLYLQTINHLPIPYELERPINDLEHLMQFRQRSTNVSTAPGQTFLERPFSPMTSGPNSLYEQPRQGRPAMNRPPQGQMPPQGQTPAQAAM